MKFLTILTLIYLHLPLVVSAQTYTPLLGDLPGGLGDPGTDFNAYINALYVLSISIAALLAVIKIVIAGVKWMTTDIVTTKGEAKKDIQGAVIGLLIVLSAVVILTIINPQLVQVDLTLNQLQQRTFTAGSAIDGPTPYTINQGDSQKIVPSDIPDGQERLFCESRNEELCELSSSVGCYKGEYYVVGDKEVCVVRDKYNLAIGEEIECDWIGLGPKPRGERDTFWKDWDCENAEKKCQSADLDYDTDGSIDSLGDLLTVDLIWVGNRNVTCK